MSCEVVAAVLRPLVEQRCQRVDRCAYGFRIGVTLFEDGHEIISTPDEPSVEPGDVLEETEWVLDVCWLHQLPGGFGESDVGCGGATAEGTHDISREPDHLSGRTARARHGL